jgi:hypothetical protein
VAGDEDAFEALYARGVTDGLPVLAPTPARVQAAVAASGRRADELIGLVAPRHGRATVEKIAVNAVMAGCRPEYLPVVIAAVEAMCDPAFALEGVSGTTDAGEHPRDWSCAGSASDSRRVVDLAGVVLASLRIGRLVWEGFLPLPPFPRRLPKESGVREPSEPATLTRPASPHSLAQ